MRGWHQRKVTKISVIVKQVYYIIYKNILVDSWYL